jgi:ABC-type lipoprotein export system ATPase subunit
MLLRLEAVSKGFGNPGDPSFRHVLDGLDLQMDSGESLAILGPSGSGKTTLLNLVGGLEAADRGNIHFKGEDLQRFSAEAMDSYRNRDIGFVFQFHHLLPQLTLLENVLVPTLAGRAAAAGSSGRAEKLMKRVGIWEYRHKLPGQLSGGECQRAAVVRAMINGPSLLLADEPTGALDRENVASLAELLLELNREEGLGLLVVTHSTQLASRMERTLELRDGRLHTLQLTNHS